MISDDFLPAMTGVGTHLKLIAPELVRRGHRVSIITSRRKGEAALEHWEGVTIYRLFTIKVYGFYLALPSQSAVRAILNIVKPDIVHHHYVGFMMRQVCAVAESLNLPQVSTFHISAEILTAPLTLRPLRGLAQRMIVHFNNRFDLVIAPSQNLAKQITSEGIRTPVRFITNPVVFGDSTNVVPADRTPDFTVLNAGRLAPEKNVVYLLKAFAALQKDVPGSVLWVAGTGPEYPALKSWCDQLGITGQVKFLGFLDHPTLARYYAACDVFVSPSLMETQGLVVMEAMWFSRPVIVTSAIVSATELVANAVNGYIVDPDVVDDLTKRLVTLVRDPKIRSEMGIASRLRADAYRPEPVVDALEASYRDVLQQRAHG
jgi:glycosyltransferase involved in cell wall biosynthesis